jgi:hypothetical protein
VGVPVRELLHFTGIYFLFTLLKIHISQVFIYLLFTLLKIHISQVFIFFWFTLLKINIVSFQGSQGGQTEKQCFRNKNLTRETSNVSELDRKHSCFPGSKICFRNNVSTGGQMGKHSRKH